ncbi:hypothetical protein O0L34_g6023 [Tuta absoluta]|nr:hypothetical protein O0L34_g6023 [Tuta absoluta]
MAANMDLTCGIGNTIASYEEENTYKQYHSPTLDDEDLPYPLKGKAPNLWMNFSTTMSSQTTKKKKKIWATTVGRATKECMTYISSNEDNGAKLTHLIKIEIIDLEKNQRLYIYNQ